jgi:hypothetical protein
MKKNLCLFFSIALILPVFIVGCAGKPRVLKSADGTSQLTVPGGWKPVFDLNKEADVQAADKSRNLFVTVFKEDQPGNNLEMLAYYAGEQIRVKLQNGVASKSYPTTISGNQAFKFDASGTLNGEKFKFLGAVVKANQNYFKIITWTSEAKYESYKSELLGVIESFIENPSAGAPR